MEKSFRKWLKSVSLKGEYEKNLLIEFAGEKRSFRPEILDTRVQNREPCRNQHEHQQQQAVEQFRSNKPNERNEALRWYVSAKQGRKAGGRAGALKLTAESESGRAARLTAMC